MAKAYLIGEAASEFAAQLGDVPHEISGTLEKAVARAAQEAQEGEVVLLAPACASFDQFESFEARGEAFREACGGSGMKGRCTCGAVEFRLTDTPLFTHCCHCRWCQRETGSAFVLNAMIEAGSAAGHGRDRGDRHAV